MPLMDSRRLKVLKNLQTTLQGMTGVAYHFPVTDSSQVTLDPTVNPITGNGGSDLLIVIEPTPDGQKTYYPAEQLTDFNGRPHYLVEDQAQPLRELV